jgi:hypothetical protein
MRKLAFLFSILLAVLLTASVHSTVFVSAQTELTSYLGSSIPDDEIDGGLGDEWSDAGKYSNVTINPNGTAEIWTKHDETYLYIGLSFNANSDNPWVAFQFIDWECMQTDADGALFGHDDFSANGYTDITFKERPQIIEDSVQDGVGAISVDSSNTVTVELKKPLDSNHVDEKDVAWTVGNQYSLIIMWDSDGGGSSGGTTSHRAGNSQSTSITLSNEAIPEFSTIIFITILCIGVVMALIYRIKNR